MTLWLFGLWPSRVWPPPNGFTRGGASLTLREAPVGQAFAYRPRANRARSLVGAASLAYRAQAGRSAAVPGNGSVRVNSAASRARAHG